MKISDYCKNYFKIPDSSFKDLSPKDKRITIAKIVSYVLILPPLVMGIVYGFSSLIGRFTKKSSPTETDKRVVEAASTAGVAKTEDVPEVPKQKSRKASKIKTPAKAKEPERFDINALEAVDKSLKNGRIEQAKRIVSNMSNKELKDKALGSIMQAESSIPSTKEVKKEVLTVKNEVLEKALNIADAQKRGQRLAYISIGLAKGGKYVQAYQVADQIPDETLRKTTEIEIREIIQRRNDKDPNPSQRKRRL